MNTSARPDNSLKTSLPTVRSQKDIDRRDGNIRGIIIGTKDTNLDHVFGPTRAVTDNQY